MKEVPEARSWSGHPEMRSLRLTAENIARQHAIVTDHSQLEYALIAKHAQLIVDSRGVYREPRPNVVKA